MAKQNLQDRGHKAGHVELVTAHVLRRELVTSSMARVTVGGPGLEHFTPLGFDQWFRLFIPVSDHSLSRVPAKLNTLSYLKFLTVSKTDRPILRNYTVRAFRPAGTDGPEMDIDFVVHGSTEEGAPDPAGPACTWAQTCGKGDAVALLDEGAGFNPAPGLDHVRLVADETGLPAAAAILESLAPDTRGHALLEVPTAADRQDLRGPAGVEIEWIDRNDPHARPGAAALAQVLADPVPDERFYGWVVGENALPVGVRRHWVAAGAAKDDIMFCGYWKAGKTH